MTPPTTDDWRTWHLLVPGNWVSLPYHCKKCCGEVVHLREQEAGLLVCTGKDLKDISQRENFLPFLQWTSHFFFLFHKLSCPFYNFISSLVTAERKTSLGKDWHGSCLRCENCNKTLLPGSHSEHDGKPYCNHPCYSALFGPGGKFWPRSSTISPVVMSTKWDCPDSSCLENLSDETGLFSVLRRHFLVLSCDAHDDYSLELEAVHNGNITWALDPWKLTIPL